MKLKSCMAVHCNTEEKAKVFIKECYKQGFTWWVNKDTDEDTFWYDYKKDTVYFLSEGHITYDSLKYYYSEIDANYFKLYEYDDLIEKIKPLNEKLTDLVDELYKNLQYRMCLNGGCPYESLCDGMLDELNVSVCDIISDMVNINRGYKIKKKESKMINIGQSGSAFTLGQYNKEVK